jgi:hypothetical protein
MSPRHVDGPIMSLRKCERLDCWPEATRACDAERQNERQAWNEQIIKRLDDEVAASRLQSDNAKRVRTEDAAVAKVLVDHFPMFTEEDLYITQFDGRTVYRTIREYRQRMQAGERPVKGIL